MNTITRDRLIGLQGPWRELKQFYKKQQIPHALLFHGMAHVGKHHLARRFARLLNCATPTSDGEPCGECLSCLRANKNLHPDIYEVFPTGQTLSIDAVREIITRSSQLPQMKKFTVFVVDGVETLQTAAANSFLKILEEPAPFVQFLLISENRNRLLKTLQSRLCPIDCPPCPEVDLQAFLATINGLDPALRDLLPMVLGPRPGLLHSFFRRRENLLLPTCGTLAEALQTYEDAFALFKDWLLSVLKELTHFPTEYELQALFQQGQVMFFSVPRFRLIQGLFGLKERPRLTTVFFLTSRLECLFFDRRDEIKKELANALDGLARDPILGRDLFDKERLTEWKQTAASLLTQRFQDESRELVVQVQAFCHLALRAAHQESLPSPLPPEADPWGLRKFGPSGLRQLYLDAEKTLKNLSQNAQLPLQLLALFSRLSAPVRFASS